MARAQVVSKKGRNSSSAKKGRPAGRTASKKRDGGPTMAQGTRPRPANRMSGDAGRLARERRPVSTRAALGFKDDE